MKKNTLFYITVGFFIVVHSQYFWQYNLGIVGGVISTLMGLVFLFLMLAWVFQLYKAIRQKFKARWRLANMALIAVVLVLTYFFSSGVVDAAWFKPAAVLTTYHEDDNGCVKTIVFNENGSFFQKKACFSVQKTTGTYRVKGDTLILTYNNSGAKSKLVLAHNRLATAQFYNTMADSVASTVAVTYHGK